MRILVLDSDAWLADSLAAALTLRGHEVRRSTARRTAPDAVILGLPAPCWISPPLLPSGPLLVLAGEVGLGEIERWIADRRCWAVMTKPASESRIARWLDRNSGVRDSSRATFAALDPPADLLG